MSEDHFFASELEKMDVIRDQKLAPGNPRPPYKYIGKQEAPTACDVMDAIVHACNERSYDVLSRDNDSWKVYSDLSVRTGSGLLSINVTRGDFAHNIFRISVEDPAKTGIDSYVSS